MIAGYQVRLQMTHTVGGWIEPNRKQDIALVSTAFHTPNKIYRFDANILAYQLFAFRISAFFVNKRWSLEFEAPIRPNS